jgi:hypothetical protein
MKLRPGPVDLSLMVDLDLDLDFPADGAEAAEFALLVVVVRGVELNQTKIPTLRIFAFINYTFLALTELVLCGFQVFF